jgi:hypothetical protein
MAVGILLIILVLSIQMLVIFDANMKQITQLLATIKPQKVLSPNEVVTGTDYGTAIQPKTSQPHIQSITTNNDNATDNTPTREATNNLLPTTDSLSFWNAVDSILQLNYTVCRNDKKCSSYFN